MNGRGLASLIDDPPRRTTPAEARVETDRLGPGGVRRPGQGNAALPLTEATVLNLQRAAGNTAVVSLLRDQGTKRRRRNRPGAKARRRLRRQATVKLIHGAGDTWTAVKAKHLKDEPTMQRIVDYRKWFVDGLINELRQERRFKDLKTRAAGSTALSSDYDITFMGETGALAVQEFNRRFRGRWGKEAGTVFDTNVYAEDVLPAKEKVVSKLDDITLLGDVGESANVDARLDEGLQDVSSLVKVRKNMTRDDWGRFTDGVLRGLAKNPGEANEAQARFVQANTIYERTYVQQIIEQLESDPAGRARVEMLRAQKKSNIAIVESIMANDEGIAASNRVYEAKLLYAAELEDRRSGLDPESREWKSLTVDLRKAKADAMLFANEPYFAAGTLYHVVGNIQAKFGAALSSAALFQSLQENYGDTLKELHHLHGMAWRDVAIKSSKYVWRTLDAAVGMRERGIAFGGNLEQLRDAFKKALDVRQNAGGVTADEALDALKALGITNADILADTMATVAADANVAFRFQAA